jgi:replicative DNA helicase
VSATPVKIFISYSHRDESFKNELESHLAPLKNQGMISPWSDRKIVPGAEGDEVIDAMLSGADIILLLISADFCNSIFCWQRELDQSLRRHDARQAIVIPIIVRTVDLQGASFGTLQSLPTDRKPVATWADRDEAWTDVSRGIRKAVESVQDLQTRSSEPRGLEQILNSSQPNRAGREGLQIGYKILDYLIAGLKPSELMVIAARPGMGKTALALNVALNVAFNKIQPVPVAIFSMENSCEATVDRMIAALARVDSHHVRSGRLLEESWPRVDAAISLLGRAPIYVDETAALSIADISARVSKMKERADIGLIIIDQLQMLRSGRGRGEQELEDPSIIVRDLKAIARELNTPVVLTSQVRRDVDRRVEKRPLLSDLPDGYDLDVYADIVLFIYREEVYDPNTSRQGIADVMVAKNRNGVSGEVNLVFSRAQGRFDEYLPEGDVKAEFR